MNPIKNGEIGRYEGFLTHPKILAQYVEALSGIPPVNRWLEAASEQFVKNIDKIMMEDVKEVQEDLDTRKGAPDLEQCFEVAPRLKQL
jgi:hypothetical protein